MIHFSLCITAADQIPAVQKAGFDGFEFSGAQLVSLSAEELNRLVRVQQEAQLPCIGLNDYCSGTPALVGPAYSASAAAAYAENVCRRAALLGAHNIGIGAPKGRILPAAYDKGRAQEEFEDCLAAISQAAGQYHLQVLVEALNRQACNYLNTTGEADQLVRAMNRENLHLVLDFYHSSMQGEKPEEQFRQYAADIRHIHFSTALPQNGRGYPAERDEAEYRSYLAAIEAAGYQGWISLEPSYYDPETAEHALRLLREWM